MRIPSVRTITLAAIAAVILAQDVKEVNIGLPLDMVSLESLEQNRRSDNRRRRRSGDRYLYNYGRRLSNQIVNTEIPLSEAQLERIIDYGETLVEARGITQNAKELYASVGFQTFNSLGQRLSQSGDTSTNKRAKERLDKIGFNAYSRQSYFRKTLSAIRDGNFGYIRDKVVDLWLQTTFFLNSDPIRDDYKKLIKSEQNSELSRDYLRVLDYFIGDKLIMQGTRSNARNVSVDFIVGAERDLYEKELRQRFGNNLLMFAVAAYASGSNEPSTLAIDNGEVVNFLVSDVEGVMVINQDGTLRIKSRTLDFMLSDITQKRSDRLSLDISRNLYKVGDEATAHDIDMLQSHLLVYNTEVRFGPQSSKRIDKRRAFVQYLSGEFGIVSTKEDTHLTLHEFASLLKRIGVKDALNLDVGYNDFSGLVKRDGSSHYFGKIGEDRTNNLLVFYRK